MDDISYTKHNAHYVQDSALTAEKVAHERNNIENFKFLYQADVPHGDVLDSTKFKTAIDIGSGTGWFANYLVAERKYTKVYAIEPSESAIDIAKKIYPDQKKVKYINGFAEEELSKIKLTKPSLFSTLCVLTHLKNETVIPILSTINKIAQTGSVLACSEAWGIRHIEDAWNIRPPEWWVENLPNWEFEFYNDYILPHPTDHPRYKGFIATKL